MIQLIAILDKDGALVGGPGVMPFVLDELQRLVREQVEKKTVVAGRRTWELFGSELPAAQSIVLSRSSLDLPSKPSLVVPHLDVALGRAREWKHDVVLIGGASVFRQALTRADELRLAYLKPPQEHLLDFPAVDGEIWWPAETKEHPAYELITYHRRDVA